LAERHAAAIRQTVIAIEKMVGTTKKYFQLKTVMVAKERPNVHAVRRMSANDSGEAARLPGQYHRDYPGMNSSG